VLARYARNRRLADALQQWAFCAMRGSPGARTYYQRLRARKISHQAALRQLANRLVGILHGCLKTHTATTNTPPGPTSEQPQLDFKETWDVCQERRTVRADPLRRRVLSGWRAGERLVDSIGVAQATWPWRLR
jgi:hypothetical protein